MERTLEGFVSMCLVFCTYQALPHYNLIGLVPAQHATKTASPFLFKKPKKESTTLILYQSPGTVWVTTGTVNLVNCKGMRM
jgi:hypothetical protein